MMMMTTLIVITMLINRVMCDIFSTPASRAAGTSCPKALFLTKASFSNIANPICGFLKTFSLFTPYSFLPVGSTLHACSSLPRDSGGGGGDNKDSYCLVLHTIPLSQRLGGESRSSLSLCVVMPWRKLFITCTHPFCPLEGGRLHQSSREPC